MIFPISVVAKKGMVLPEILSLKLFPDLFKPSLGLPDETIAISIPVKKTNASRDKVIINMLLSIEIRVNGERYPTLFTVYRSLFIGIFQINMPLRFNERPFGHLGIGLKSTSPCNVLLSFF